MTPNKPTHTPTPWAVNKAPKYFVTAPVMRETLDASGGKPYMAPVSYPVGKAETAEDAAFIVRAVNAHEELLEALKLIFSMISDGKLVRDISRDGRPDWALISMELVQNLAKVQQAIAKAEGC